MALARLAKSVLQKTGLYPAVRALRRSVSPSARALMKNESALYKKFIAPGEMVFDVGVNVGQKSEIFLACGFRVIGIEPNPNCRSAINYQFGRDPRFEYVAKALGSETGKAYLNFVAADSTASMRADWPYLSIDGAPVDRAEVEVTTLDAIIEAHGLPRFCKIDVEGFEFEVLSGLSQPIPYITFEYHLSEQHLLEKCMDRLASIAPIKVNVNRMYSGDLLFRDWVSPERFLEMISEGGIPPEADCWVEMAV